MTCPSTQTQSIHTHALSLSLTHNRIAHSHIIALPEGGIASKEMIADARDLLSIWLETGELIRDQISGKSPSMHKAKTLH